MTLQVFVSVSFQVESSADVESVVNAWALPEGAVVSATASEQIVQGTVADGQITAPSPPPEPPPVVAPTNGEEPAP